MPPSEIQGLKIRPKFQSRPRISRPRARPLRPNLSNPAPPGEGAILPPPPPPLPNPWFWQLFSPCCGLGAVRPLLASPRPQQRNLRARGAAGTAEPAAPSPGGGGEPLPDPGKPGEAFGFSTGPGRAASPWTEPTLPRESPRGLRAGARKAVGPPPPYSPAAPLRRSPFPNRTWL